VSHKKKGHRGGVAAAEFRPKHFTTLRLSGEKESWGFWTFPLDEPKDYSQQAQQKGKPRPQITPPKPANKFLGLTAPSPGVCASKSVAG